MDGETRDTALQRRLGSLGIHWGWFAALGIASILIGLLSLIWPVRSTLGLSAFLGALLAAHGALQLLHAAQLRAETGTGFRVFHGAVALVTGALMLRYPLGGMAALALALSFYFFVSGVTRGLVALWMRPIRGWGWAFASSLAALFLGAYVIATFPASALWIPGVVLGADFVMLGVSLLGFAFALRWLSRLEHRFYEEPGRETA